MKFSMDLTREPFCRSMSRLLLRMDKEPEALYVGVTPDGENPGRLSVSQIKFCRDKEELPFTAAVKDGKVRVEAGDGWAELAIALPNRLLIQGRGLTLLFGNGKGAGVFMGGGSAVQDTVNPGGALLAMSGSKLRFVPCKGQVEVSSCWDLNALSDPDPRVYLHPDQDGALEFVMYESDFDEIYSAEPMTVDEAATQTVEEFEDFLKTIKMPAGDDELFLRAAYSIWTALQPARELDQKRITTPEYITGRTSAGTAKLADNTLLALLFKEPAAAVDRMASFLKYMQPDGMLPRQANNRMFLIEAELPLFGLVLRELLAAGAEIPAETFDALCKAYAWWKEERWCCERKLFYYLHRYEPGCCVKLPFADTAPEFAPDLNALMLLWLEALAAIAKQLGRDAGEYEAAYKETHAALLEKLWAGDHFIFTDILDQTVCQGHPRALLPLLLADSLPAEVKTALADAVPAENSEDALYLACALGGTDPAKLKAIADALRQEASGTEFMNVRQALTLLLVCGMAS